MLYVVWLFMTGFTIVSDYDCLQVRRGGEMTGGVVVITSYQTVQLQSVILMVGHLVVVALPGGRVVTQQSIAPVRDVRTTEM